MHNFLHDSSRRASGPKRAAFTLIELLVVIAIIGILASLALVGFQAAKQRVQILQCKSNLRQIGMGLQTFVADKHFYPVAMAHTDNGEPSVRGIPWWTAIAQEIPGTTEPEKIPAKGIWRCPTANHTPVKLTAFYLGLNHDYGYNSGGISRWKPDGDQLTLGLGSRRFQNLPARLPPQDPVADTDVVAPSEMIAIGDGIGVGDGVLCDLGSLSRQPFSPLIMKEMRAAEVFPATTQRAEKRHTGKANMVFCDNHVEALSLKTLFFDTSDGALSRWNRDHKPHRDNL